MTTRGRYNPINYTNLAGKIDHGLLLGLGGVADHTGYLLVNGGRALGGHWDLGGYNLTNGAAITISGTLMAGAGNAAAPSIVCSTYGGMYGFSDSGNNALGFSTAGGQRLRYTQYNDKWAFSAADIDFASGNLITTGTLGAGAITGTSLALGGGNLTMSGSIASVGTPVLKGWFTDLDVADDLVVDSDLTVGGLINDMTIQGTADGNIAIGNTDTLLNVAAGAVDNIAIGRGAGKAITTADYNVLLGSSAGAKLQGGQGNFALGWLSLSECVSGLYNVGIGTNALRNNTASNSIAIGYNAGLTSTTSTVFVAIGAQAMQNALTGCSYNVAIGNLAMIGGKTVVADGTTNYWSSQRNVAIGYEALRKIKDNSSYNTCIGFRAGYVTSSADYNTLIGYNAGVAVSTGGNNTLIGGSTGATLTTGTDNIIIGYAQDVSAAGASNELNIGGIIYSPDYRAGVRFGDGANETQISATGVLTMAGTARVYKNLFIRPAALGVGGAAPASATVNALGFSILEFADAADDYAQVNINTPSDMDLTAACEIRIAWSVPNTSANMTWGYGYCVVGENEDTEGSPTTSTTVVTSSSTADGRTSDTLFTIPADTLAAGDLLQIYFYRDVSADAYSNPVDVHGMALKYTANKLGGAVP